MVSEPPIYTLTSTTVTVRKADLEVGEAVVEENVPAAEEELFLTDAQQAGHQGIQSLAWREKTDGRHLHQAVQMRSSKSIGSSAGERILTAFPSTSLQTYNLRATY